MSVTGTGYLLVPDYACSMALTSTQTLQRAVALFQQGNLVQTQALCEQLLVADRNDCGALHLRALIALQNERVAEAIELLRRSIAVDPRQPAAHLNLANALLRAGKPQAALASCDTALAQRPDYAEALVNRGNALLDLGRASEALASYDRAVLPLPDLPPLHNNRGRALQQLNRHEAAVTAYRRALRSDPHLADALVGIIDSLRVLGRLDEALTCAHQAIERAPRDVDALHARARVFLAQQEPARAVEDLGLAIQMCGHDASLWIDRGSALFKMGQVQEALADYDRALTLAPNEWEALFNHANALFGLQRYEEALADYDRVIADQSAFALAYFHRGNTLRRLGRPQEALDSYSAACSQDPTHVAAIIGTGNAQRDLDRPADALRSYDRALSLEPENIEALRRRGLCLLLLRRPEEAVDCMQRVIELDAQAAQEHEVVGTLLHARLLSCDWRDYEQTVAAIICGVRAGQRITPPSFLPAFADSPEIQYRCASSYVADRWGSIVAPAPGQRPQRHARVRVAYVSADYHEHPVSMLMAAVFEGHDRDAFEVIGVSLRPPDSSPLGRRVQAAFDVFLDASTMSDRDAAEWMRKREVDIAIDLTGYTAGLRPGIFAMRGAPIQVSYLGYPGTSAAPYIDYLLADRWVIPEEQARFYSEKIAYLPDCYLPHDDGRARPGNVFSREIWGLPADGFVFCSFNAHHKITPAVFDVWMRLLQAVPASVLWLAEGSDAIVRNLSHAARTRGIDAARLIFAPRLPNIADHLARHQAADLFLDTFPYNAHTTASDALFAGLPVLTYCGTSFAARVAASLLQSAGLPDLICPSLSQYESAALDLARNPARLLELRNRLSNARTGPPFDTRHFCRSLESAYRTMLKRFEDGVAPASFVVSDVA
jgi:protein O-GlcNAc transferase